MQDIDTHIGAETPYKFCNSILLFVSNTEAVNF